MKKITHIGSVVGLALTLSACGTLYKMDVAAYSTTGNELGNTYVILSANPNMDVNSPQFELHAKQLERAMASKGFKRVTGDELQSAALGVYVAADISDPSKKYHTVRQPVYNAGLNQDLGSAARDVNDAQPGGSRPPGELENMLPPPPVENLEGFQNNAFATTVYTKHLNLIAIDLQRYLKDIQTLGRSEASPIEVWSVDIESTGQPDNLSDVIPIMIAAAQPYIADETGEVVQVKLTESDKRVTSIKHGN